jgi:hypothetical protein
LKANSKEKKLIFPFGSEVLEILLIVARIYYRCDSHGPHAADLGRVYMELLRRGYEVSVGKVKNAEVDFCAEKGGEKIYVQVMYLLASYETMERCRVFWGMPWVEGLLILAIRCVHASHELLKERIRTSCGADWKDLMCAKAHGSTVMSLA